MQNPYYKQEMTNSICETVKGKLPQGLETTFDFLLDFMSKSDNERVKETAEFVKGTKNLEEIGKVFNFVMSLLKPEVEPITETIYDKGIASIKDLNNHMVDKLGKSQNAIVNAKVFNTFGWIVSMSPAKEELKKIAINIMKKMFDIYEHRDERHVHYGIKVR